MHRKLLTGWMIVLIMTQFAAGGTTGKLTGRVTDSQTGEPLIGVNVMVVGSSRGAATDLDGRYMILNIAPGEYVVQFSIIGYAQQRITDVRIMVDLTTTLDAGLVSSILEGETVTVTADRSMIQADITHAQANISAAELEALPVESFQAAVSLQAGVVVSSDGAMHVRGGRSSEIAYMIDGIPVTNVYGQSLGVGIENNAIQELQLISGTFNAEYGQAMSGIINIITREGDLQDYAGELTYRFGRYISPDPEIYFGLIPGDLPIKSDLDITRVDVLGLNPDVFTPAGRHDIQWSLSGPLIRGKSSFFLSGRYEDVKGRLYGIRRFHPDSFIWDNGNSRAIENGEMFSDFEDLGSDGCGDAYEDGTGGCSDEPTYLGDDPNGDNWDPLYNPNGTEGNLQEDADETGDGLWGGGDRVYATDPNVRYDSDAGGWYYDEDGDFSYDSTVDSLILFPVLTYEDLDGNGYLSGEWYLDEDNDGTWDNHRADNAVVPLYNSRDLNLQGKFIYNLTTQLKLSLNLLYGKAISYNSNSLAWKYTPEGRATSYGDNLNLGLILQHNVSPTTFHTFKASLLGNFGRSYYKDIYDVNWGNVFLANLFQLRDFNMPEPLDYDPDKLALYDNDNKILRASTGNRYNLGGISKYQNYRMTRTQLLKWDLTSQVNQAHQIQAGVEYKFNSIFRRDFSILYDPEQNIDEPRIIYDRDTELDSIKTSQLFNEMIRNPWEFAIYLQDKIELVDMIVNAGLRYEIFDPAADILADPADPNPYSPLRLQNQYHDLDGDGSIDTSEAVGSNAISLEERLAYWFKPASRKIQISPRLAVAYPITEMGVLHFSYGHFFQIPSYSYLYINSDFEVPPGSGVAETTMGNADLEPQRTVQYEIGLQQQFGDNIGVDVTGFYKDISNLLGSKIVSTFTGEAYGQYVNRDYGNVKGITIALTRRMNNGFSANLDYTYSVAEGNASDPASAFWDAQNNREAEKQLVYLNWDQRHTLNGSVMFRLPYGVTASLIGEFGSGFPYTPSTPNVGTSFENSGRKPSTLNVDMRLAKRFDWAGRRLTLTANVYNLLDIRNENTVFSDTGRSGYSLIPSYTPEDPNWSYNTLEEYLYRPGYYSAPRQIRLGVTASL